MGLKKMKVSMIAERAEMDSPAKKNKIIGLLGMVILSVVITCGVNKQFSFFVGFWQSYIFLNAFSLFDALVIDKIWFCHGKWWVIPGTEDMTDAYHDYAFHRKWFFLCLVSSLPLAAIIGGIGFWLSKCYNLIKNENAYISMSKSVCERKI